LFIGFSARGKRLFCAAFWLVFRFALAVVFAFCFAVFFLLFYGFFGLVLAHGGLLAGGGAAAL